MSNEFDEVPAEIQKPEDIKVSEILTENNKTTSASGALNDDNDPYQKRRSAHAERYYEMLRRSKPEPVIRRLSKNSGMSLKSARKVYYHVFINKYDLGEGVLENFYPSYDMAESFRRLLLGDNIQKHDIILMYHERLEYELMNRYGKDSRTAHELTCKKYNYGIALKNWQKEKV